MSKKEKSTICMSTLYTPELTNDKILADDAHRWPRFCADFRLWEIKTKFLADFKPAWQTVKFDPSSKDAIPSAMGVYMFVLESREPQLVNGQHSYVMYVGQAGNLRERFSGYFRYPKSTKPTDQRKRIMVLIWQERLQFHFFETPGFTKEELTAIEFDLINMTVPPMNNLFRGDLVNNAVKAYGNR